MKFNEPEFLSLHKIYIVIFAYFRWEYEFIVRSVEFVSYKTLTYSEAFDLAKSFEFKMSGLLTCKNAGERSYKSEKLFKIFLFATIHQAFYGLQVGKLFQSTMASLNDSDKNN